MSDHSHPAVSGRNIPLDAPELPDLLRFFHGHIGPYAVLGYRIGQRAMDALAAGKYFDMDIEVTGLKTTPYTCLIDGLQVSTGCTLGKGNIAVAPDEPPPDVLFRLEFSFHDRRLTVTVPETVKRLFAAWLRAKLSETDLFAKTQYHPAEELWTEQLSE